MTLQPTRSLLRLPPKTPTQPLQSLAGGCASVVLVLVLVVAATLGTGTAQAQDAAGVCRVAPLSADNPALNTTTPYGEATHSGASWSSPMTLQKALATPACQQIRVRQGVYKPVVPAALSAVTGAEKLVSFAINRPLQLLGGYTGVSDTDRVLNARNTVLSGDIDQNDLDTRSNGGITERAGFRPDGSEGTGNQIKGINSVHVLTVGGSGDGSVGGPYTSNAADASFTLIEGFSITGGQASVLKGTHRSGGGLYCNGIGPGSNCSPRIRHTAFNGNWARYGGAIRNHGSFSGNSTPRISHSTFSGNFALFFGGAMYNDATQGTSSPTISHSTFHGNSAAWGGALFNHAIGKGISSPTITHATFSGNSAGFGGAIYNEGTDQGTNKSTSEPTITASILWGNSLIGTLGADPDIYNNRWATTTLQWSIAEYAGNSLGTLGANNIRANPHLGVLQDNGGSTYTMLPSTGSASFNAVACNASGSTVTHDQRGVARPQGALCDMGAVERQTATNTLRIAVAGAGAGSVSGGLGACATTTSSCSVAYGQDDPIAATLRATPRVGSTFTGWAGACTNTSGNCVVTMNGDRSVTASFALYQYAITANANPAVGGEVSCSPNVVSHGSTSTCTATAQPGYLFTGWSGDCTGMTCTLVGVRANKTVAASFEWVQTSFSGTTVPSAGVAAGPASANFTGGGASCSFDTSDGTAFVAAPTVQPVGQTLPHGMLQLKLIGCDATPVTMSVTWPAAVKGLSQFGKATAEAPTGLTTSGATTTFILQDGQNGDDDWTVNGEIMQPVGATVPMDSTLPQANLTPVPTLGQWALVLLSLMAAALGGLSLQRRRAVDHY